MLKGDLKVSVYPIQSNKMVDTTRLTVLRTIYTILCTLGLIVHMSFITIDYLRYDTVTSVYIEFPTIVESPALSVCFKYKELIEQDLFEMYGHKLDIKLNDIFRRTPSANQCCVGGLVRNETNYGTKGLWTSTAVLDHFEVSRFFAQEAICYRLQLRVQQSFDYLQLGSSTLSRMIYGIGFSWTLFEQTSMLLPIVHASHEYPLKSIYYSPAVDRSFEIKNVYSVSSQRMETHSLKYPYKSDCIDYQKRSRSESIRQCVTQLSVKRLGLFPYSQMHYEADLSNYNQNQNLKQSRPTNIVTNRTLLDGFNAIRNECNQLYHNIECDTYFYTTFIDGRFTRNWNATIFLVNQPIRPTISTIYQATQDFYTFSLLILSCFGVWLGWSLSDFNPINLISFMANLRHHSQQATLRIRKRNHLKTDMMQMKQKIVELEMLVKQTRA